MKTITTTFFIWIMIGLLGACATAERDLASEDSNKVENYVPTHTDVHHDFVRGYY